MKKLILTRPAFFQRAEFLSPKDLLQRAAVLSLVFLLAHLAGLREFTCVLNGTEGSIALGWKLSAFLGVSYLLLYMAFVILVPVMILAAMILMTWQRCWKKERN